MINLPTAHTGLRRLNPAMLETDTIAARFDGFTDDHTTPGIILAAFKSAAPQLGLSPRIIQTVDWLFRFTQPQDWQHGQRPIVWPSAAMQRDALGLSPTRAKALNRHLVELGFVVMRDSPNGKRYGRRDRAGRIIEAYGFDLSPLAARLDEFRALADAWKADREAARELRRRATIARKAIEQLAETAGDLDLRDAAWPVVAGEARRAASKLAKTDNLPRLRQGVEALEAVYAERKACLDKALAGLHEHSDSVNKDPKGSENGPHQYTYKATLNPIQDTVIGIEKSKSVPAPTDHAAEPTPSRTPQEPRTDRGTVMKISPDELIGLAPRLRPYLTTAAPAWPEIVDAADWLRHDLGVSKPLWGDACLSMGREQAAIALAIVSTKPASHFRGTPGGYFHGMVTKARAGDLNLGRSIWGLRIERERAAKTQVDRAIH